MPQTVTATVLGSHKSVAQAAGVSNANTTTSLDVLTVAHGLGASPYLVYAVLRSVVTNTSGGPPNLAVRSWNASQVILDFPPGNGAGALAAQFDVICEYSWSPTL